METVLLVDDSNSVRRVYGAELEREGYCVVLATDGDEVQEIVDEQPIDLVILDVRMRRVGGLEAMARLRSTRPGLPIVLHSSCSESDVLRRSQHKPDAYVGKSGSIHELKQVVSALLLVRRCPALGGPRSPASCPDAVLDFRTTAPKTIANLSRAAR